MLMMTFDLVDLADDVEEDFPMEGLGVDRVVGVALDAAATVGGMAGFAVVGATSSRERGGDSRIDPSPRHL